MAESRRPGAVIVDYGMGNLRSVQKAFERLGCDARLCADPAEVLAAERLVVPGVGAFGDCMANLRERGLDEALRLAVARGVPYLGICLGLQALFTSSDEFGPHAGLDLIPGRVVRFAPDLQASDGEAALKVPHMGWNAVQQRRPHPLFEGVTDGTYFYFVHSYHVVPEEPSLSLGVSHYGPPFVSAVAQDNVVAVQFHPEKSQRAGLKVLENFAAWDGDLR